MKFIDIDPVDLLFRGLVSLLLLGGVFGAIFGATVAIKAAASDGVPDYCYVTERSESGVPVYALRIHRPWSFDGTFLVTADPKQVQDTVQASGCFLKPAESGLQPVP